MTVFLFGAFYLDYSKEHNRLGMILISFSGRYTNTLVLTDIASGWTECVALLVREGSLLVTDGDPR